MTEFHSEGVAGMYQPKKVGQRNVFQVLQVRLRDVQHRLPDLESFIDKGIDILCQP